MAVSSSFRRQGFREYPKFTVKQLTDTAVGLYLEDIRPPPGQMWRVLFVSSALQAVAYSTTTTINVQIYLRDESGSKSNLIATAQANNSSIQDRPVAAVGEYNSPLILTNDYYLKAGHQIISNNVTSCTVAVTAIIEVM